MGKINLTSAEKAQLESGGFLGIQATGGPEKRKYYLPDGKPVFAIPGVRAYVIRDRNGNVTERGTRDANLDKGWLPSPPAIPKIYCPSCDGWHDTEKEIKGCQKQKKLAQKRLEQRGLRLLKKSGNIEEDKNEIAMLKEKLDKMEKLIETLQKEKEA